MPEGMGLARVLGMTQGLLLAPVDPLRVWQEFAVKGQYDIVWPDCQQR